jgi:hypothetical protein
VGVILVAGMVGFCGSRSLPASAGVSALVSGVVGSVLAAVPRRGVAVGCAICADALVVSSALALGASSRLRVFAAFGPVSPPWPAARVFAPGASSSVSSVSGVAGALASGASVSWRIPRLVLSGRAKARRNPECLAERVKRLFETVTDEKTGEPYTELEVARLSLGDLVRNTACGFGGFDAGGVTAFMAVYGCP